MNVALFCAVRNENIYINEYIEYYLNLGFNHIYIVDNSSDDQLDIIINPKFKNNISIINIRTQHKIDNFFKDYQSKLYTSLYNIYSFKYDWVAFFDIDEFLILKKHNTIQEYISSLQERISNYNDQYQFDQIHISWVVYDDNDHLYYSPEPVIKRFTRISKKYYEVFGAYANGVKSIIRSNLDLHFITPHTAISNTDNPLITIDNDGYLTSEYFSSQYNLNIEYSQLNHYITKSTEEYLNKTKHNGWDIYDKYFQVNEYSDEKSNILKSLK